MKLLYTLIVILFANIAYTQTITTKHKLIIAHEDITLYLDDDTCTMISKHILFYSKFKLLKSDARCDCWFADQYSTTSKATYDRVYRKSGYDLGHLTPSHITTYDAKQNEYSFSLFNQAPQYSYFNEHPWEQLERHVEHLIDSAHTDAIIVTGVIYNNKHKTYLTGSKIKIPTHYYKLLTIGGTSWIWLAPNVADKTQCVPKLIQIAELNDLFVKNAMNVNIKLLKLNIKTR